MQCYFLSIILKVRYAYDNIELKCLCVDNALFWEISLVNGLAAPMQIHQKYSSHSSGFASD